MITNEYIKWAKKQYGYDGEEIEHIKENKIKITHM